MKATKEGSSVVEGMVSLVHLLCLCCAPMNHCIFVKL